MFLFVTFVYFTLFHFSKLFTCFYRPSNFDNSNEIVPYFTGSKIYIILVFVQQINSTQ